MGLEAPAVTKILSFSDWNELLDELVCYGFYLNEYIYIGKTTQLKTRITQHLVRLESIYHNQGRLFLRDMEIHLWYCHMDNLGITENRLIKQHQPKLNRNGRYYHYV